ncbi:UDP:flavonoid glycosyltransferase YjiC (YdhE family) [Bradyrhizobium japonicum]
MSYDFLLASWGTLGNLSPLLTAARRLHRNGHHIRVMADPAMRSEVEASGFAFVAWRRAPTGKAADPVDVSDVKDFLRQAVFDPAALYAADVRDEIGRMPTDAVLVLDVLFGAALGAEASGEPFALLSPHVSNRKRRKSAPKSTPPMPGWPKHSMCFCQVSTARVPIWVFRLSQMSTICSIGPTGFCSRPVECSTFKLTRCPRISATSGPLLDVPNWSKSRQTEAWRAPWSAQSGRPRGLIACSTGAQGQRELFQRIITAMEAVEIDALATAGPNVDVADLRAPNNVHLVRGAPHDLVMKDVSVVISQGGHGTTTRSLINGLPQLILPMGRDQAANAARVEAKGAGLQLPPTASEAEIAAAVNRLIAEPQFRKAARLLGEAMKVDIDRSGLVDEMEAIAAIGRAARPQPKKQPLRKSA